MLLWVPRGTACLPDTLRSVGLEDSTPPLKAYDGAATTVLSPGPAQGLQVLGPLLLHKHTEETRGRSGNSSSVPRNSPLQALSMTSPYPFQNSRVAPFPPPQ